MRDGSEGWQPRLFEGPVEASASRIGVLVSGKITCRAASPRSHLRAHKWKKNFRNRNRHQHQTMGKEEGKEEDEEERKEKKGEASMLRMVWETTTAFLLTTNSKPSAVIRFTVSSFPSCYPPPPLRSSPPTHLGV
ncbi:hypothetical protein B296_00009217 [Ensete ventricosum]|uniref:Uncharacterized protein n=1 Tax=Ensete ventricosum TaxID=4639 RepID=A0A426ZD57_ENSVE|nr:hypothetical protein B296_00009217 [Ensete ventricosum]